MAKPIQLELLEELQQEKNYDKSIERCTEIIKEIEEITNRRTIAYFASTQNNRPEAFINDGDSIHIEDILRVPSKYPGLNLILNSTGGYAISAERIINVCENYVAKDPNGEFKVIVPKIAKSAATIVALGADKVILCENAELGPIDPQLVLRDDSGRRISKAGYQITKAVNQLLEKSSSIFPSRNEAYLNFLKRYDYDTYAFATNETELSESIADKILKKKREEYPELTSDVLSVFTDPSETLSHGRLLGIDDLRDNVLCDLGFIQEIEEHYLDNGAVSLSPEQIQKLGDLIWELFIRKTYLLNDKANPQVKVIEGDGYKFISGDSEWKPAGSSPPVDPVSG